MSGIRKVQRGEVVFDGAPDRLPADLAPMPSPPFLAPNELIVTEMIAVNPDGTETLSFWIEGQDPAAAFPTPGAPLFTKPFDPGVPPGVILGILGLEWTASGPGGDFARVVDISATVTFDGGAIAMPVTPIFVDIAGDGVAGFDFTIEFAPNDFLLFTPGQHGTAPLQATDLHVDITIAKVPEPAALLLAAFFGLIGAVHRRKPGDFMMR